MKILRLILKNLLLLICIILLNHQCYASDKKTNPITTNEQIQSNVHIEAHDTEINILKTQLADMQKYQSDILSTVHWALSSIITVFGLLIGFGWFANFRVYNRDRKNLEIELNNIIENHFKNNITYLDVEIQKMNMQLNETIKNHQKNTRTDITESHSDLKNKLSSEITEFKQKISHQLENEKEDIINSLTKIKSDIFDLKEDILEHQMKTNPSKSMALTDALYLLRHLQSSSNNQDLSHVLSFIMEKLNEGGQLTAHELTDIQSILDNLPSEYKLFTQKLNQSLIEKELM
jgi:hypothetical protein